MSSVVKINIYIGLMTPHSSSDLHGALSYAVANTNQHAVSNRGNALPEVTRSFSTQISVAATFMHYN